MKHSLFSFFILISLFSHAQLQTTTQTLYSTTVQDSFEIKISSLGNNKLNTNYATVYYLDANLRSGIKLRELLASGRYNQRIANVLFIGIGYKGNNVKKRKRDFIPPLAHKKYTDAKPARAHANRFYAFLTKELIPLIEKGHTTNGSRTLIGHSLGGLFVFYTLFQQQQHFKSYIALSPSLWVNRSDIFNYEKANHSHNKNINAYLYLSAGKKERFNYILKTTRRMKHLLLQRNYIGLRLDYAEHKGKAHHTQVPISLAYILQHTEF